MAERSPQFDDEAAPSVDLETRFDLLSSPLRRSIITILYESPSVSRHELTARLTATMEGEETQNELDIRRRIRIALHHNHLPRLADAGVIEYDADTVTATSQLTEIGRFLSEYTED